MEKNDGLHRWYNEICGTMGKDRGEQEEDQ